MQGQQARSNMTQTEVNHGLHILVQTLGERIDAEDDYPEAMPEQHGGGHAAQAAEDVPSSKLNDIPAQSAQATDHARSRIFRAIDRATRHGDADPAGLRHSQSADRRR